MNRILLRVVLGVTILGAVSATALAQGRGRGNDWGRRSNWFADRDFRGNRWRRQDWKCGKFVNCHDARDGRVDGRGPWRTSRFWRNGNGNFFSRGSNVGYRNRYRMNDYWRRRHLMNDNWSSRRWRY